MKKRQIPWERVRPNQRFFVFMGLASLLITAALLFQSCRDKEVARLTTVYGKITDQAGQPVDSVTIIIAGSIGLSAGFPFDETQTDLNGEYRLKVNVPKKYSSASVNLSFRRQELLDKYLDFLIYKDGVQQGSCCAVKKGDETKYDFILLPK